MTRGSRSDSADDAGGAAGASPTASPPSASPSPPPAPALAATVAALPLGALAKRTAVVLAVAVCFAAGLWFVLAVRQIILWLVIAAVLAMALEPLVAWLTRHHVRRGPATILVCLVGVAMLAGAVALLAVPLVNQARQLINDLPNYVNDLTKPGSPFASVETRFHVVEKLKEFAPKGLTLIVGAGTPALHALRTTFTVIAAIVSIMTMTVLLLIEGPRTWDWVLSLMAAERRPVAQDLGSHLLGSVGGYVRGNLFISLIAGVAAYIAMLILGVPFALPLAVTVAVLDLIPLVGATLGAIICVIVGGAAGGWVAALILAAYFIVYQQVENNLIQTTVYSRTVALSPLAVLVASLCGAAVAGIVGVLLAIPVAATVVVALIELRALRTGKVPEGAEEIFDRIDEGEPPVVTG
jgi:predicted PurR-regulated permease PerM